MPRGDPSGDMIQGMLDMLTLTALSLAPMHGWGRQRWIASDRLSRGIELVLGMEQP